MVAVGQWLESNDLGQYGALFEENRIEFDVLPDLTEQDLEKLGIPLGDRKRLLKAIATVSASARGAAVGGYVRQHWHSRNEEILFCFAGQGTILVDGEPHPFVPGTTAYLGRWAKHKIVNEGLDTLKFTWTFLPPGLDEFFAGIGRPRRAGEPAPEPFDRPERTLAVEQRTGFGPPIAT